MTNIDYISKLPEDERKEAINTYKQHPLNEYIDWKAFFESTDGNEMNFLKVLEKKTDEYDNTIYVLEELFIDGIRYEKIYNGEYIELIANDFME